MKNGRPAKSFRATGLIGLCVFFLCLAVIAAAGLYVRSALISVSTPSKKPVDEAAVKFVDAKLLAGAKEALTTKTSRPADERTYRNPFATQ